jgi:hypothetical protein
MGKMMAKVGALLLCGSLGVVLAPGCTIRIGPGTDEDGPSNPSESAAEPDGTSTTDGETLSPEEQAAIEALKNADPDDVKLVWCLQDTFTPQIACESGVPPV